MAKERLVFSENDFGHIINISVVDASKNIVNLRNQTVKGYLVNPENIKNKIPDNLITNTDKSAVVGKETGVVSIEISQEATNIVGNWAIYLEFTDTTSKLTSTKAIYYYVMDDMGGAEDGENS